MIYCWLWLDFLPLPWLLSTHRLSCYAGIAVSNDPVLQTRVLAYADTQRYRLGVNYQLLPVSFAPGMYCRNHLYASPVLGGLDTNEIVPAKWRKLSEVQEGITQYLRLEYICR